MNRINNSRFSRLLGVWKTTGNLKSGGNILELTGIDSYELVLEGNYILHKADVKIGNDRRETFEMIKLSDSPHQARMYYFNSKGEEGVMTASIVNNEFGIKGSHLKFGGVINEENTTIIGKWYTLTENKEWEEFIDLTLKK